MAGRLCIAAVMLAMTGCVRVCCEPTGRVLFGDLQTPGDIMQFDKTIDGAMGGIDCDWEVLRNE